MICDDELKEIAAEFAALRQDIMASGAAIAFDIGPERLSYPGDYDLMLIQLPSGEYVELQSAEILNADLAGFVVTKSRSIAFFCNLGEWKPLTVEDAEDRAGIKREIS